MEMILIILKCDFTMHILMLVTLVILMRAKRQHIDFVKQNIYIYFNPESKAVAHKHLEHIKKMGSIPTLEWN